MSSRYEEFWSTLPEKVLQPRRMSIVEALWRIGEPLSAVALVEVLDDFLNARDTAYHLRVLDALDVIEPVPVNGDSETSRNDPFDVQYRLKDGDSGKGA